MFWMCFLVVASLTTGQLLRAEDPSDTTDTDKVVPIKTSNGGLSQLKVQEADPYKNLHVPAPQTSTDPGKNSYDPRAYSMNQTSSMANKPFSTSAATLSKNGTGFVHDKDPQFNKSYGQATASNLNAKYSTPVSGAPIHDDSQFNKGYTTPTSSMGNQTSAFASSSRDQNRKATLVVAEKDAANVYDSNLSKQYLGPGAQHVPPGLVKENVVIEHVSDIPNRPLTIDEVRGLINHGFKPDTTASPDAPTKAINDPDYKPEASPEPIDTINVNVKVPPPDDDKDSPLPSPGTMSQPPPENTESLPQH